MLLKCCNRPQASGGSCMLCAGIQGSEHADSDSMSPTDCTLAERVLDSRAPEPSACVSRHGV
jgi:hypothetical protein